MAASKHGYNLRPRKGRPSADSSDHPPVKRQKLGAKATKTEFDWATAWDSLPPELQEAVVIQLPFRQRAAFRRVCKTWKAWLERPQAWADVRRLSLWQFLPRSSEDKLALAVLALPWPHLGNVRRALAYLGPRCPLASLEFNLVEGDPAVMLWQLMLVALKAPIQLETLVILRSYNNWKGWPGADGSNRVPSLLLSQAKLRTLILRHCETPLVLKAAGQLQELRLLILCVKYPVAVRGLPGSLLRRLDCLAVVYRVPGQTVLGAARPLYDYVRSRAPQLKLQGHKHRHGSSRIVWAKEGFRWETATASKARYSRDFLRDWESMDLS